ncbi:NAD(P)/FAD-dependent oxidoreductase [Virgibacillus salexigens]|uniref:NAD(P)/FAD-dependent oxidoreductase n=1 Tax=Virgibacillus massiliensis TaxID=1462526 RepID=UPI001367A233|nr:FAD-binding oxidoreductase [Virgibacillus massiliensis]MYL40625.1 FAD-dependent oxidoreductase [Virgibacillus massiliensis]
MDLLSMWEGTANNSMNRSLLEGEECCDVVIIGGGFTGLSTAYHLQEKQCSTIVLEQGKVGCGASGRNGGEVLTGYLGSMEYWTKKKGLHAAKKMWQLSLDSIDLIENIINKHDISCDFKRNGDFLAAYKPSHLESMKKDQEFMASKLNYYGIDIVEKNEIKNELETSFYSGGRVDYKSAHFHPLNYTLGLAKAAEKLGAKIYERSEATGVKRNSKNKFIVRTDKGKVIADNLVIATNAYSGDLNKIVKKSVVPVESIMIATESLPEDVVEALIKNNRAVSDTKNLLYYFRRTGDNRLAFGGSGRASSKRDQNRIYENLLEGMLSVFPQLKGTRIEYRWGGKVGFTQNMLPCIGQLKDGAHFAFGYGGHGAAMASLLGKTMAEDILEEGDPDNPLRIKKLRSIPFHNQHSKAVGVMKFYKQFQDRFFG